VILFELIGTEDHPVYEALEITNGNRQYDLHARCCSTGVSSEHHIGLLAVHPTE
jgi:hypothetical protein